jgi:hypothetical protein
MDVVGRGVASQIPVLTYTAAIVWSSVQIFGSNNLLLIDVIALWRRLSRFAVFGGRFLIE